MINVVLKSYQNVFLLAQNFFKCLSYSTKCMIFQNNMVSFSDIGFSSVKLQTFETTSFIVRLFPLNTCEKKE